MARGAGLDQTSAMARTGVRSDDEAAVAVDVPASVDVDTESTARRQLQRLRRLVDELAGVEPQAALPLILSAASVALDLDQLCVHMVEPGRGTARRVAALGLAEPFLAAVEVLPVGAEGGPIGMVAESGAMVVVDDVASSTLWGDRRAAAAAAGIRSSWAVPIIGDGHLLGVASGYGAAVGRPPAELLEVGLLYAGYAAGAIERGRLLEESRALEAVQREAEALRRSQALQRDFLSRVSHELLTPLTAIHGYASSLLAPDVCWDDGIRSRFLTAIAAESDRMSRLVGDLLDVSAIESGVLRLHFDWCDLPLVVRAALDSIPPEHAARVDLEGDGAMEPVWADHDRLQQVIVNLVENGLRHTAPGTRVRVSVGRGRTGGTVYLRVSDDGPGIPEAEADRLFQPYVRGATSASGAGLGLSIVRGIVEAHGGSVGIERRRARGATFLVVLPADQPAPGRGGPDKARHD